MKHFVIVNKHGLRFHMFADSLDAVERALCRMLGKRKLPTYLSVCYNA